jgi:hypothetical protein
LVSLYRRKIPGLGIVLVREEDAFHKLESGQSYNLFMDMYSDAPSWRAKKKACDYLISESELDEDLVYSFLINNAFYGNRAAPMPENLKRDFVMIRWFKHPSDYGADKMREDISWLPTDWFKKLS